MPGFSRFAIVLFIALLPLGCVSTQPTGSSASFPLTIYDENSGVWVPAGPAQRGQGAGRLPQADRLAYQTSESYPVDLSRLPSRAALPDLSKMVEMKDKGRIEKPIPEDVAEKLRAKALLLPPAAMAQLANEAVGPGPEAPAPATGVSGFDSLDYTECCGGGGNVPADSELAVGPNHIIAVVNVAFEIYDKKGGSLKGPTTFASFFNGTPNCSGVFDPNVIYDEKEDRFILGIDADGKDYCIAVSQTGDPTGPWHRFSFATDVGRNFFDYPHAGVGDDAIYLGANMFGRRFFSEGRVWAIEKTALYSGNSAQVVSVSTGGESTPQPMNLHGWAQDKWPAGGPHYFITDGPYDGDNYGIKAWTDPFGSNSFVHQGYVNLSTATGVAAGMPIDAPQLGGAPKLDGNDFRVQDAEYRNGDIWMVNTIACNPGGGTVNCVRWAQVDPASATVIDAGVYGSDDEYRIFADLAADHCDNMAVGYTKTSSGIFPAVFVSGRESTDPAGTLQSEVLVKVGEIRYTSFQGSGTNRWGDYTSMTIDPDGKTFWYMGQYSKNTGTTSGRWGNFIAPFTFGCDSSTPPQGPGKASNPVPSNGATEVSTSPDLTWDAGAGTDTHDVYFGISSSLGINDFEGNQAELNFSPGPLSDATKYYWRIDEVDVSGKKTTGDVWSFTTVIPVPGQAVNVSPSKDAVGVSINTPLTWTAGAYTSLHKVYVGLTGTTLGLKATLPVGTTSYDPLLEYDTTYDWRIDEVNANGLTTSGAVWTFRTETAPPQPTLVPSSINNGKTWTAVVTGPVGQNLAGTWSPDTGTPSPSCVSNVCTMEQIPKKEGQVVFTQDGTGTEVTVLKP